MAKSSVAELPAKLYGLLEPLTPEERTRVVQATMILFGDEQAPVPQVNLQGTPTTGAAGEGAYTAQSFMDEKDPKNKGEALAVAARFREQHENSETHTKADLKKVFTDARRNFDDNNFGRDLNNAKRQAGFFNTGTGRDASKLSYYGQQFVDALPDRDATAKLKRPVKKSNKKKAKKKKTSAKK